MSPKPNSPCHIKSSELELGGEYLSQVPIMCYMLGELHSFYLSPFVRLHFNDCRVSQLKTAEIGSKSIRAELSRESIMQKKEIVEPCALCALFVYIVFSRAKIGTVR